MSSPDTPYWYQPDTNQHHEIGHLKTLIINLNYHVNALLYSIVLLVKKGIKEIFCCLFLTTRRED